MKKKTILFTMCLLLISLLGNLAIVYASDYENSESHDESSRYTYTVSKLNTNESITPYTDISEGFVVQLYYDGKIIGNVVCTCYYSYEEGRYIEITDYDIEKNLYDNSKVVEVNNINIRNSNDTCELSFTVSVRSSFSIIWNSSNHGIINTYYDEVSFY